MKTYAGQMRHLQRALTVALYRSFASVGVDRPAVRIVSARVARFFRIIGTVYLIVVAIVAAWWVLTHVAVSIAIRQAV